MLTPTVTEIHRPQTQCGPDEFITTTRRTTAMRRIAAVALTTVVAAAGGAGPAAASAPEPAARYIVQVKPGNEPKGLAENVDAKPRHVFRHALNGFAATLNAGQLNALRRNPQVEAVAPDTPVTTATTQSSAPWALDRIDQRDRPLSSTFDYSRTGTGVTAYVLDTGINTGHTEFEGRASNVRNFTTGGAGDCNGHGTHVAGIIGGRTFGVAKKVRLRGVKVLDNGCGARTGWSGDVIAGIDWVKANGVKPAVVNMSLGGTKNVFLDLAVDGLADAGFFVAVAAGNDNVNACDRSPSAAAKAFAVAASDSLDRKASFSNWGSCVKTYAPGVAVRSAVLGSATGLMDGTSMAAPHVAGVAALIKQGGDTTNAFIANWIVNNASTGKISGNVSGTPNRLLYKYAL
jgi:subtilisin family serine protease